MELCLHSSIHLNGMVLKHEGKYSIRILCEGWKLWGHSVSLYLAPKITFNFQNFIGIEPTPNEIYHRAIHTTLQYRLHDGVSKSFRNERLQRELQMVQLSATRCSCITNLWVSLVRFASINLCVASHRVKWDLLLARRLSMMKFSRAISGVKWLSGEKKRFEDHFCPRPQVTSLTMFG
jgi:hypothetical protein